jgi:hypothetical protein
MKTILLRVAKEVENYLDRLISVPKYSPELTQLHNCCWLVKIE